VTLALDSGSLTSQLSGVLHGNDVPSSLANHGHTGQADGGQVAHTALSGVGTTTHTMLDAFVASKAATSGLASLDASGLVVQNPANATATPTAGAIPVADANAKLDSWVRQGGECRLTLSGSNLLLSRCNGRRLIIDDQVQIIPQAGVTLAPSGVANTTYYIYAPLISGVMTLEASTTAYAADSRNGIMVKSDNPTRTLVGMARTDSNGAWVDLNAKRFVLSWYNQIQKLCYAQINELYSTGATSPVLLSTSVAEFLSWTTQNVAGFSIQQKSEVGDTYAGVGCNSTTTFTSAVYSRGNSVSWFTGSVPAFPISTVTGYNKIAVLGQGDGNIVVYFRDAFVYSIVWG